MGQNPLRGVSGLTESPLFPAAVRGLAVSLKRNLLFPLLGYLALEESYTTTYLWSEKPRHVWSRGDFWVRLFMTEGFLN